MLRSSAHSGDAPHPTRRPNGRSIRRLRELGRWISVSIKGANWKLSPSASHNFPSRPRARPRCTPAGPPRTPTTSRLWSISCAVRSTRGFRPPFSRTSSGAMRPILVAGALNALAQTLVKLAAPGVPDIYQGTELWDFSMVDPDNRRPVDFRKIASLAETLQHCQASELLTRLALGRRQTPHPEGRAAGTGRETRPLSLPANICRSRWPAITAITCWRSRVCKATRRLWPSSLGFPCGCSTAANCR